MSGESSRSEGRPLSRLRLLVVLLVSVGVAVWVFLPALDAGLHADDSYHLARVAGRIEMAGQGPLELFTFAVPDRDPLGPIQGDYLPWWRAEDLLIRFFRPLSAATYHLDHWLWGEDPRGYHASSLAWYALVVAGCVLLYAKLAQVSGRGAPTVLLAGLLFATAREHEGNAAWLAGRYTLVTAALCLPAMLAYHRWRRDGSRRALAWCVALYAASLLASETPVALAGYFFAYEVSLARDGWRQRLAGILLPALVVVAWVVLYGLFGYGTRNTLWYLDPLADFDRFLTMGVRQHLVENTRRLVLPAALEEPMFVQLNASGDVPCWPWLCWLVQLMAAVLSWLLELGGVTVMHLLTAGILAALALQSLRDRALRFALVGALLSLVPLSAAPSPQRVMLLPSVGMAWALAAFAAGAGAALVRPRAWLHPGTLPRIAIAGFLLYFSAFDFQGARYFVQQRARVGAVRQEHALALDLPTESVPGQRVLILSITDLAEGMYAPLIRAQQGLGWPEGIWSVGACSGPHRLTRTGERSFRLEVDLAACPDGFAPQEWVGLYRDEFDFHPGREFRQGVLTVRIASTGVAEGVTRIDGLDVEIDRPLDDPDVHLVAWCRDAEHPGDGAWRRIDVPPVGESLEFVAP